MNRSSVTTTILVIIFCLGAGTYIFNLKLPATTYTGTLPGADCAGLETELTLYKDHTYFLKETYLATKDGDKRFTSAGKWRTTKKGSREILQLNYDRNEFSNYLIVDQSNIRFVDKQGKDIDCPFNLTLERKK